MYKKMIHIEEGLPRFKDALKSKYFNRLSNQQDYIYDKYGFNIIHPRWLDNLIGGLPTSRKIVNIPWYNMQFNPFYMRAFAYIPPHVQDREKMIKDGDDILSNNVYQSDVVSIFLNLSAIPDECIKGLEISSEDYSINLNEL